MELIRGEYNLRPTHRRCVVTVGNFDGVHVGHQFVLRRVIEQAQRLQLPTLVMIFEPLPREYFQGNEAPARLTPLREKLALLREFSVDQVLCLRFNSTFASMSAEQFIQSLLIQGLDTQLLVVGDDFRFGRGREGDFNMLVDAGMKNGFDVVDTQTFEIDSQRVSSTQIRQALAKGDMLLAERLLGRPYRISGRVVQGDKRGRTIGFPTANIRLRRRVSPVNGVFAVRISGTSAVPLDGVANVGIRPTVDGKRKQLEVHVFNYEGNLYSKHLHVDLLHKIRDETKFDSIDALKQQIARDAAAAKDYLTKH